LPSPEKPPAARAITTTTPPQQIEEDKEQHRTMETSRSNNDDDNEPPQQAPQSRSSGGVLRSSPSPDATQAAASEPSSDVAAASITPPQTLELPCGGDDDPLTPHQIAARYERRGSKNEPEGKTEEAGDDEAPLPPAQIDTNAKGDHDTVDDSGGGRAREGSPSNFPDTEGLNELSPPQPFNPATVEDDEIKAAAAPPATQQTEHPTIRQRIRRPSTTDGEESIAIPPEDEEVGVATSRQ